MPLYSNSGQAVADAVLLRSSYREGYTRTVQPGTTLQSGRLYLLQVHVGSPLAASIVKRDAERGKTGPVPPTLKPRLFEVIIQAKDFELRSPMKRFLYLEPGGASRRVRFGVTAPARVDRKSSKTPTRTPSSIRPLRHAIRNLMMCDRTCYSTAPHISVDSPKGWLLPCTS